MWAACKLCVIEAQWDPWPVPYSRSESELVDAVPSSPPSKALVCLLWEMLLQPCRLCPSLSVTVTDVTRAGLLTPAPHNGTDNSSKRLQRDKCTFTTAHTVPSIFLIVRGTTRSTIKLVFFVGGKGGGKRRVCNVPVRTPL